MQNPKLLKDKLILHIIQCNPKLKLKPKLRKP